MADNKVTIDAAWFAELYAAKKDKEQYAEAVLNIAKERDNLRKHIEDDCASCPAVKERDELKAKLDCAEVDRETYKDRAEAAERCIEDAYASLTKWNDDGDDAAVRSMFDNAIAIIRAYREKSDIR